MDQTPESKSASGPEDGASKARALSAALAAGDRDPAEVLLELIGAGGPHARRDGFNLIGKRAGRWELKSQLGSGGMGVTYLGLSEAKEVAAVKVVSGLGASAYERFAREGDALEMLEHPGIVRYLGRGRIEGETAYMAMDFVDGLDLEALISAVRGRADYPVVRALLEGVPEHDPEGPPPPELTRRWVEIAARVADALAYVHRRGLVHRDVKPSNIMVRPDLSVALIDFGLSRDLMDTRHLTQSQALLGTPGYIAPEQTKDPRRSDPRSDQWALGLVLAHCLESASVAAAESDPGLVTGRARVLRRLERTGLPEPLLAIVHRSTHPQARRRYPSAQALADDLRAWANGKAVRARRPGPLRSALAHRKVQWALFGFFGALAATVVALLAFREPHRVSIDTTNDGGILEIQGLGSFNAPIRDMPIAPGTYQVRYWVPESRLFFVPLTRTLTIDRKHTRLNFRTIRRNLAQKHGWRGSESIALLDVLSGSAEDRVLVDGAPQPHPSGWLRVTPGEHLVEVIGEHEGKEIAESVRVHCPDGELSAARLLTPRMRALPGDYRATLCDVTQTQLEPRFEMHLEDGAVQWMNDFNDKDHLGEDLVHVRTCITSVVPGKEVRARVLHRFPEPMRSATATYSQHEIPPSATLRCRWRFDAGPWSAWEWSRSLALGQMRVVSAPAIPGRTYDRFEIEAAMLVQQQPTSYPTIEWLWGYFSEGRTDSPAGGPHRDAALAIVATRASREGDSDDSR